MKLKQTNPFVASITAVMIFSSLIFTASAADRIKQNNTTALNVAGSWDVLPDTAGNDVAVWNNTVTAANSSALGGNLNWQGIRIANPGGAITVTYAANNTLTLGTAGIDMSAATQNLNLLTGGGNTAGTISISGNQTWNVASGKSLTLFSTSNSANQRLSGTGNIQITTAGAAGSMGVVNLNTGDATSTGFSGAGNATYSGNWTIGNGGNASGTTAATSVNTGSIVNLRHGLNAWGSGTITLNGGQIASTSGNWSWTNNITLNAGTTSNILLASGSNRSLKLNGVISSSGGVNFLSNGTSQTLERGYILTGTNTMSGTATIATGAFVRVGGVAETNSSPATTLSLLAGTTGTLGTATITNNGTLTLSHSDTWTFPNNISGSGVVNIGSSAIANSNTQVVTLSGTNTYTGATTVNQGRLNLTGSLTSAITVAGTSKLAGTGSTTGLLTMAAGTGIVLAGGASTTGLTVNGATFTLNGVIPVLVTFDSEPVAGTVYDILTYGDGAVTNADILSVAWRGTITDDTALKKFTFTAGLPGTRTWNVTDGFWAQGLDQNWLEGDQKFYGGDTVIFNNPEAPSMVSLEGLLAPASVTVNNTNDYTFAYTGAITGSTGLTKSGTGALTIANSGGNSYTGGTTLSAGQLNLNVATALGASTSAFTISGTSVIDNTSANAITLTSNNPQNWNADFTFAGTRDLNLGTGVVTLGSNRNVTVSNGTLTVGGAIQGAYGLTKSGAGTLALTATSLYTGATVIHNGTLKCTGSVESTSDITVHTPGVFEWGRDGGCTRSFSGDGTIKRSTTGGNAVFSGSNGSFTGSWEITAGYVGLTGDGTVGASNVGMTLNGGGIYFTTTGNTLASTRTITLGTNGGYLNGSTGNTNTFAAKLTGSGPLRKVSGEKAILTAVNDFSGNTEITGGGTLEIGGAGQFGNGTYAGTIAITGGAFSVNTSANQTLSGVISGAGPLSKNNTGILSLTSSNTYTGSTTILGGTLEISGAGQLGAGTYAAAIAITSGSLTVNSTADQTLSGVVSGAGSLTKNNSGTLTLGGNNTYTGDTIVSGGKLAVNGTSIADANKLVIDGGKVEPTGSETVGTLYFGATQQASGTWGSTSSTATHKDDTRFSGTGVVLVTTGPASSGLGSWLAGYDLGGQNGIEQDPDNDGIDNGAEFVLKGGNPATAGGTELPTATRDGNNLVFRFERDDRAKGASSGVTIKVEAGASPGQWTSVFVIGADNGTSSPGVNITNDGDSNPDLITVTIPTSGAPAFFARLRVEETP